MAITLRKVLIMRNLEEHGRTEIWRKELFWLLIFYVDERKTGFTMFLRYSNTPKWQDRAIFFFFSLLLAQKSG